METEPKIIEQYVATGQVRLVYRHLAQLGERSELLAEYSECAADQGHFWEMRRALYERVDQTYDSAGSGVAQAAAAAGVDEPSLEACVAAHTHREMVRADYAAATQAGIRSRPVFTIGAQTLVGAQRLSVFQQSIDTALAGS